MRLKVLYQKVNYFIVKIIIYSNNILQINKIRSILLINIRPNM